jgi:8-oxo-dGTP diphosphatase
MRRSIAGIAIRDGKVLVAKRKAGGAIGLMWEFPGGKLEEGETDEMALVREFDEEFGIKVIPLRPLGSSRFLSPSGERLLNAWLVEIPADSDFQLREHTETAWVGYGDLSRLDLAESDRNIVHLLDGQI